MSYQGRSNTGGAGLALIIFIIAVIIAIIVFNNSYNACMAEFDNLWLCISIIG